MKQYETMHLVKQEDLNHHGTLFAARGAAWLVEAAFAAAGCACGTSEGIVCRNLSDMSFQRPVSKGTILKFSSRVVYAGKTSFCVFVTAEDALCGQLHIEGKITFVTVDENSCKREHHIVLDEPEDETERRQRESAEAEMREKCSKK